MSSGGTAVSQALTPIVTALQTFVAANAASPLNTQANVIISSFPGIVTQINGILSTITAGVTTQEQLTTLSNQLTAVVNSMNAGVTALTVTPATAGGTSIALSIPTVTGLSLTLVQKVQAWQATISSFMASVSAAQTPATQTSVASNPLGGVLTLVLGLLGILPLSTVLQLLNIG